MQYTPSEKDIRKWLHNSRQSADARALEDNLPPGTKRNARGQPYPSAAADAEYRAAEKARKARVAAKRRSGRRLTRQKTAGGRKTRKRRTRRRRRKRRTRRRRKRRTRHRRPRRRRRRRRTRRGGEIFGFRRWVRKKTAAQKEKKRTAAQKAKANAHHTKIYGDLRNVPHTPFNPQYPSLQK